MMYQYSYYPFPFSFHPVILNYQLKSTICPDVPMSRVPKKRQICLVISNISPIFAVR